MVHHLPRRDMTTITIHTCAITIAPTLVYRMLLPLLQDTVMDHHTIIITVKGWSPSHYATPVLMRNNSIRDRSYYDAPHPHMQSSYHQREKEIIPTHKQGIHIPQLDSTLHMTIQWQEDLVVHEDILDMDILIIITRILYIIHSKHTATIIKMQKI